jgi:hypothetical protein
MNTMAIAASRIVDPNMCLPSGLSFSQCYQEIDARRDEKVNQRLFEDLPTNWSLHSPGLPFRTVQSAHPLLGSGLVPAKRGLADEARYEDVVSRP